MQASLAVVLVDLLVACASCSAKLGFQSQQILVATSVSGVQLHANRCNAHMRLSWSIVLAVSKAQEERHLERW
jgi:hypothetical protein